MAGTTNKRKGKAPPKVKTGIIFRAISDTHAELIDNTLCKHYDVGTRSGAIIAMLDRWKMDHERAVKDANTVRALVEIIHDITQAQQDGETADRLTERRMSDLFALGKSLRKDARQLRIDIPLS